MRKLLFTLAALTASTSTFAIDGDNEMTNMSNFNYDFTEARIGADPLTFGAGASKSIHPNAHVSARVDSQFDSDFDASAGFGFHAPINNWADITGDALMRITNDTKTSNTDIGMELNIGIRQWLGPQLEVGGAAGYVSIDEKKDWIGNVYARFHSTEYFSLGAAYRINDFYDNQFLFTARFKY